MPMSMPRLMSQESLNVCTESLSCETGSPDFLDLYAQPSHKAEDAAAADSFLTLRAVRYLCSRPQRAFPPPLPSMCHRDDGGPCLRLRRHCRDGRLVLEAVAARPQVYLHAQRQGGLLRLCFVKCSSASVCHQQEEDVIEEEEE